MTTASARYASVRRFVSSVQQQPAVEARVVITSAPGEEGQVDYGEGPMVRDADSGKYRRTRLFVLTLGYSRKAVRLLVQRSSAQVWAELHERAFRRLGGTVRVVVLDNLKEGVLTPDIYDPTLNPLYRDVLAHYGVVALPCRVGDPDRKGKVEAAVGHAQKTPLRGLRFERLDIAQAYLDRWERRWADTRIHGTTKRQVAVMFAEDRPALARPLEPVPLLPVRPIPHRASRRLRRGRGGSTTSAPPGSRSVAASSRAVERRPRPRSTPEPDSSSASTCARLGAGIASRTRTGPPAPRPRPSRTAREAASAPAPPSPRLRPHPPPRPDAASAASSASSRQKARCRRRRTGRRPPPSNSGSPPIGSCGARTSTAGPRRPSRCVGRPAHPGTDPLRRSIARRTGDPS